jgi:hypothetical protein
MTFNVINVATKEIVATGFWDGATAAAAAKELTESLGTLCQPRRAANAVANADWKERERKRLADGTYTPVCWDAGKLDAWGTANTVWGECLRLHPQHTDHFVHVSKANPALLSYTQSDEKGSADIQTPIKPGKYLKEFYGDYLGEASIRSLATEHMLAFCDAPTLKFADTADEIERIYTSGPSSCMSHSASDYSSSIHPTRVYAAGDLAVAYLTDDDGEHIVARALCWPTKNIYSRIYGYEEMLTKALKAAGYQQGSLKGARMLKEMDGDQYVVPYVDGAFRAYDEGDYLIITPHGDICCETTNGLSGPTSRCEHCNDGMTEEEGVWIEDAQETWCEHCVENYTFYCEYSERTCTGDYVRMANGDTWSQDAFDNHGLTCEATGRHYPTEDTVTLADGTIWSQRYYDTNGFPCVGCDELFACDDAHGTHDEYCTACGDKLATVDDDADDAEVPAAKVHVARPGRDESPAQLELPVPSPAAAVSIPQGTRVILFGRLLTMRYDLLADEQLAFVDDPADPLGYVIVDRDHVCRVVVSVSSYEVA